MEGSKTLWVEFGESSSLPDLESKAPLDTTPTYICQAVFACQVVPLPFPERLKLKWGFSPAFLLEEAHDRQRLFVEEQFPSDCLALEEWPERRTIALRCMHYLNQPELVLSLVAKVCAPSPETARQAALEFWQEIQSTFPLDYQLAPATSRDEFRYLTGWEILDGAKTPDAAALVSRLFTPWGAIKNQLFLLGGWSTMDRSDEQIWRALGGYPEPILLDFMLRPTVLSNSDRLLLQSLKDAAGRVSKDEALASLATWSEKRYSRLYVSLMRPYLLQVRLISSSRVPEYLARAVGSVLTRPLKMDELAPGYQVTRPAARADAGSWAPLIFWLERLPNPMRGSNYDRLLDMVDIGEAHAVFRLPYPPEPGLPGASFDDRFCV